MPEITVLTAVRNGADLLQETIDSVLAQTFEDWEHLIVDDGSTDGTAELVEEAAGRDGRIRLLRRAESGGPFVAANEGVRQARGRFIARLDGDDISLPDRLQTQADFLRSRDSLRACCAFAPAFRQGEEPDTAGYTPSPLSAGALKWFLCLRCAMIHSTLFIEKAALEEIGLYRELPLSQDYRLFCDLARRGWVAVVPEFLGHQRKHTTNVSVTRKAEQRRHTVDLLQDHLRQLSGEEWTGEDAALLTAVGGAEQVPLGPGLRVLRRWDRLWGADAGLTAEERGELADRSEEKRRQFIRGNAKRQPWGFARHLGEYLSPRPAVL